MEEYTLSGVVTISVYTKVKAKSEKEAIRIAESREEIVKHESFGEDLSHISWIADDYDGEVMEVHID